MVKTGREDGEFVICLPDSSKKLHKKVGKSFHIFSECTKIRWICSNAHVVDSE